MSENMLVPTSFVSGESVSWCLSAGQYLPSEGWEMFYSFKGKKGGFDIGGEAEGDSFKFTISIEQSDQLTPGRYWWQLTATKEDQWYVIDSGELEVKLNLTLLDSYDGRTHIEQVLDALEACLLGKASRDQMSYAIAGRSLSRMNPAELLKWRDQYKVELVTMWRKKGILRDQNIKVRF